MTKKIFSIAVICAIAILAILAALVAGLFLWQGNDSSLTAAQKEKIVEAYKMRKFGPYPDYLTEDAIKQYEKNPLVWFDENGGKRDAGVYRYFGTYGDCIVMLRYGREGWTLPEPPPFPIEGPFPIRGLRQKVYSPVECGITLYNTNPNYPKYPGMYVQLESLEELEGFGIFWLTDKQLEQLTYDLEKWIAEGNY